MLGRVCVFGRGGGNKKLYRFIDFYRRLNCYGIIYRSLYDPNRTARISFVLFGNGLTSCLLKMEGLRRFSKIYCGSGNEVCNDVSLNGYSLTLRNIGSFNVVSNVESKPFYGGSICRAGGSSCVLLGKDKFKGILKLRSGWHLEISLDSIASVGKIDKIYFNNVIMGSAGKRRALGFRPKVRGVAKNPCDHPHGGGNGKKAKPPVPRNSWSTVFKWKHTKMKKVDRKKRYLFKTIYE